MRVRLIALVALMAAAATAAAQGYIARPWLGISLAQGKRGVLVKQVVPDTPADKAGLLAGDEILTVGDGATKTTTDLQRAIDGYRVGDEISIQVLRRDEMVELSALLAPRLDTAEVIRRVLIDRPAPAFDLSVVSGTGSGKLADYRGKVVIVEFFSVTCRYCTLAHTEIAQAVADHGREGLVALGVAADDLTVLTNYLDPDYQPVEKKIITNFGERVMREPHHGELGFPALHDAAGEVKADYWVQGYPTFAVVDRDGFVRHVGAGAGRDTARAIAAAVALLDEKE